MFVPNSVKTFGSKEHLFSMRASLEANTERYQAAYLEVKKIRTKYLHKPTEPCTDDSQKHNTTACIAEFIEDKMGCSVNIQGIKSIKRAPCKSKAQFNEFIAISNELQHADSSYIYNLTRCLSSCEKDRFDVVLTDQTEWTRDSKWAKWGWNTFTLYISMHDSTYVEEKEYIIYDSDTFIADVGGYMGLLLGSSIIGLLDEVEGLLRRFKMLNLFK